MQSGESEPLDLGLPISNLDGLRVVLDVAEHSPGKGEEHTHIHTHIHSPVNTKCENCLISYSFCMCISTPVLFSRQTESSSL